MTERRLHHVFIALLAMIEGGGLIAMARYEGFSVSEMIALTIVGAVLLWITFDLNWEPD